MKKYLVALLLITGSLLCDYKRLTDYGQEFYANIVGYVRDNPTASSSDVLTFINSSLMETSFKDAATSGYTREQLIFSVYQSSFGAENANPIIINALHDAHMKDLEPAKAALYVGWITTGVSGAMLLYLGGFSLLYFKRDRRAINHYRNNAHSFVNQLRANTTNVSTNTNRNSIETTPFVAVPDPFF